MSRKKVVVVLSGGMDSTTMLYKFLADKYEIPAVLSFDYGQRHIKELECAKNTVAYLNNLGYNIRHVVISVPFGQLAYKSSLTGNVAIPEGHYAAENMKLTVVPNRNMIFTSIAASLALTENADLALGIHAGDHAIYPDCRLEFIQAAQEAVRIGNWEAEDFEILAPFLNIDKGGIVLEGLEAARTLGLPVVEIYNKTWTCYKGGDKACGKCGSCVERVLAFHDAYQANTINPLDLRQDPVEYENGWVEALSHALNLRNTEI